MGYILPIQQYEYINYQKRDVKSEPHHHFIENPFKVSLDMQSQFNYEHNLSNKEMFQTNNIDGVNRQTDEQVIAIITGKGLLFNETI